MPEERDDTFMTQREILRDIHSKTNEMYTEVMGNPRVGRLSLTQRIDGAENKIKEVKDEYKTDKTKVIAGFSILSVIFAAVWEWFKKHI